MGELSYVETSGIFLHHTQGYMPDKRVPQTTRKFDKTIAAKR